MGDGAENNDCYAAFIFKEDEYPFLLISGVDAKNIHGEAISDGYGYDTKTSIEIDSIKYRQLVIEHYYGLMNLRFEGVFHFILLKVTRYLYIKYHLMRTFSKFDQFAFNKRRLGIVRKQQLLNLLLERHLDRPDAIISPLDLMTRLHSLKWLNHPDSETEQERLALYLKAFVGSGELASQEHGYKLLPQTILTLEELEETVRRHEESAKIQKRLVHVTWVLVAVTFLLAIGEILKHVT